MQVCDVEQQMAVFPFWYGKIECSSYNGLG